MATVPQKPHPLWLILMEQNHRRQFSQPFFGRSRKDKQRILCSHVIDAMQLVATEALKLEPELRCTGSSGWQSQYAYSHSTETDVNAHHECKDPDLARQTIRNAMEQEASKYGWFELMFHSDF
eukprot:CAMPEP_0118673662 /NCGR_PEP_ID=MMETSP0800-20121206/453_1 /TAXON_ID=210618 ORGANISM="Striatella unipunctata, Strain CCMP2910" /NCGR_SAMPLE_ID=MMETSP0800 /ASSEMBLY_ACC=CAM_ASM_000638 /LENGTH=122 /DNA_ID=CAMNT_0006568763 /DNA_START=71 /DNA_END=442 /DNA_ORIENTATION=+